MKKYFFFLSLFFLSQPAFGLPSLVNSIKGHAEMIWQTPKKIVRFQQIILIGSATHAQFETLDDFGNTLFYMEFYNHKTSLKSRMDSSKELKKLLKAYFHIPLTRSDISHYLLYQVPPHDGELTEIRDSKGKLLAVEKKTRRKKNRYRVEFSRFKKRDGNYVFPQTITFIGTKSRLTISWIDYRLFR